MRIADRIKGEGIMKIIVNKEIVEKIEVLQYEVESRKDIISQMLANGMNTSGDAFKRYHDEYQEYFIMFNKAKQEMLDIYKVPKNTSWNLDFSSYELTTGNEVGGCSCGK